MVRLRTGGANPDIWNCALAGFRQGFSIALFALKQYNHSIKATVESRVGTLSAVNESFRRRSYQGLLMFCLRQKKKECRG